MVKKKEKTDKAPEFNTDEYVQGMDIPVWIKTGFLYHTEVKKLTFKSEKELTKEFEKFMKGRD